MADQSDYDDKTVLINSNTKAGTVRLEDMGTVVQQPTIVQQDTVVQSGANTGTVVENSATIQERLGISEITAKESGSLHTAGHSVSESMGDTEISRSSVSSGLPVDNDAEDEKTRVLLPGFQNESIEKSVVEGSVMSEVSEVREQSVQINSVADSGPVVGWLVVVDGPGKGNSRQISYGNNTIGRNSNQRIALNFGDDAISSEEQAYIQYHHKSREFLFVPNLAKPNVVEVNETNPVSPIVLNAHDVIRMGETSLLFVPLCGANFEWNENGI